VSRRTALLEALDGQLRDGSLDSITIADISRSAGVTRSAFYFYFENKAAAVAALMEQMYDDSFAAADLLAGEELPRVRIEAMVRSLFAAFDRFDHLFRAMLEARATSAPVREMWESDRQSFVPAIADVIATERAAGRAPSGPGVVDPTALATVLLELNDRMLERLCLGGPLSREQLVEAVVAIWTLTIYGCTSAATAPSTTNEGNDL
jgi:AcrR family transcriptional regulator